jgi:hypothetical protein
MRAARYLVSIFTLISLLSLVVVDGASASNEASQNEASQPVVQPKITAVSSTAVCNLLPCAVTVTLTYNVPVGFTANAYRAFTVIDLTHPATCVSTSLTPSPVVGLESQLLLRVLCSVSQSDVMHLVYTAFLPPNVAPGYVYSLSLPHVSALSPQLFDWVQGRTIGCPPVCALRS